MTRPSGTPPGPDHSWTTLKGIRLRVTPARVALLLVLIAGLLTLLFPAGLTRDYVNHLARNHIEANIWRDADLQRHYGLSFDIIPDLTMDFIVPWLSWLTGTWRAGAFAIWLALILPVLGGLVIARTAHGRLTWLSLGGCLGMFSISLEWGFVNYVASTGLCLLAFSLWMQRAPGLRRMALFALLGLFLALNHALAFLAFGLLALVWECASFAEGERGTPLQWGRRAILFDAPAMLPGLLLIALATMGAADLPQTSAAFFSLSQKAYGITSGLYFFNPVIGLLIFLIVAGFAIVLLSRGYLWMPRKLVWICTALLLLNLLIPTSVLGIWGLHLRFGAMLVIMFFASVRFTETAPAALQRITAIALLLLVSVTLVNGAWHMHRLNRQTSEVREVLKDLPRGARLLSAYEDGPLLDFAFAMHATGIGVIDRAAYVPGLFTNTSPVDVSEENIDLHMPQSLPLTEEALQKKAGLPPASSQNGYWSLGYADGWPHRWDYILYFRGQEAGQLTGLPLCSTAETLHTVLYKVGAC